MGELDNMMQPLMAVVSEVQADAQRMRDELNRISGVASAAVSYVEARTRQDSEPCTFCREPETQHKCYCYDVMKRYNVLEDAVKSLMERIT